MSPGVATSGTTAFTPAHVSRVLICGRLQTPHLGHSLFVCSVARLPMSESIPDDKAALHWGLFIMGSTAITNRYENNTLGGPTNTLGASHLSTRHSANRPGIIILDLYTDAYFPHCYTGKYLLQCFLRAALPHAVKHTISCSVQAARISPASCLGAALRLGGRFHEPFSTIIPMRWHGTVFSIFRAGHRV